MVAMVMPAAMDTIRCASVRSGRAVVSAARTSLGFTARNSTLLRRTVWNKANQVEVKEQSKRGTHLGDAVCDSHALVGQVGQCGHIDVAHGDVLCCGGTDSNEALDQRSAHHAAPQHANAHTTITHVLTAPDLCQAED